MFYFATATLILRNKDERNRRSFRIFFYFSTGILVMITIYVSVQATFGQEMWIGNADYPGGSGAYLVDHAAVWYQTFGTTASVVLNVLSDGFLVRLRTSSPRYIYILTTPSDLAAISLLRRLARLARHPPPRFPLLQRRL